MSDSNANLFKGEADIMFRLRHPHIVSLMGFVNQEPYMLIMEFMEKGNLADYLKSNSSIDWSMKKQFSLQIAQGMFYLHGKDVLHRDLKSLNVLLNKYLELKLSDFGLASLKKEIQEQSKSTSGAATGTIAWMAPELLNGGKNSKESDIYAFGIVCFEIATHKFPWQGKTPFDIMKSLSEGKREEIPSESPFEFKKLIEMSWNQNPKDRKSFGELVEIIQKMEMK